MIQTSMDKAGVRVGNVTWGFALVLIFFAMAIAVPAARAQVVYGSITGNVQDKTGAVIADATVIVTNQATGETRTTTTNSSGEYHVVDLAPGPYTVSIKASSAFAAFLEKRLDPTLPQTANIEAGGVAGNPRSAGINAGHGDFVPRVGIAYRLDERQSFAPAPASPPIRRASASCGISTPVKSLRPMLGARRERYLP